jgi:hypothetical protein
MVAVQSHSRHDGSATSALAFQGRFAYASTTSARRNESFTASTDRVPAAEWHASDSATRLHRLMTRLLELWQALRDGADEGESMARFLAAAEEISEPIEWSSRTPDSRPVAAQPTTQSHTTQPDAQATRSADRRAETVAVFASLAIEVREQFVAASQSVVHTSQDGLTVVDPRTISTDRYEIAFESADAVRITDRASGEFTRVWGDPHVDLSTRPGDRDGEFSDLSGSQYVTTFRLTDGTRVRFDAPDTGVVRHVDVIRGDTQISGTGYTDATGQVGLFHEVGSAGTTPIDEGDVVVAGEDGATWYNAAGRRIWG